MKTTVPVLYDRGLFDIYDNEDEVPEELLLIERRRPNSKKVNDDVIQ